MSFDGLLALAAVIVGLYAVADAVQRKSLYLLLPVRQLLFALVVTVGCIAAYRIVDAGLVGEEGHRTVWSLSLQLFSFCIPLAALGYAAFCWKRGELPQNQGAAFVDLLKTALRERKFDEVDRLARTNRARLAVLSPDVPRILFDRAMVRGFFGARSFLHIELLVDDGFLSTMPNAEAAIDAVIREQLVAETSPLRSAVIREYGGHEDLACTDEERALFDKSIGSPKWYKTARHALLMAACDEMRSGSLDNRYNQGGRDYEANQGISPRSRCVVFLALKAHVLGLRAAIARRSEEELYARDLYDLLLIVLEHSQFDETIWGDSRNNWEHPTPFAYLLYETVHDLERLAQEALEAATHGGPEPYEQIERAIEAFSTQGRAMQYEKPVLVSPPSALAGGVIYAWALCVWVIARDRVSRHVSPRFRDNLVRTYLEFLLNLAEHPAEISPKVASGHLHGIDAWRDHASSVLRDQLRGDEATRIVVRTAADGLDWAKIHFMRGRDWLDSIL